MSNSKALEQVKTIAILLTLILFSTIFAGCQMPSLNISGGSSQSGDYYKGTKGVTMSFMSGLPPAVIYEGDRFETVVELRNVGSYPEEGAPEGKLYISGFDRNAIDGYWEENDRFPTSLPGKTPVNPVGGQALKVYYDREARVPFDNERYEAPVQVTSCYKYRTVATPVVCIDPEPGNRIPDKPCSPQTVTLSGGQGAPIAVTKVEPRTTHDGIYFTIHFQNVGGGKLIASNAYSRCPFDLDYNDIDKILVEADLPYDTSPECIPQGTTYEPVILSNSGSGAITCRFNNPGGDAYTTPLNIKVDYVYSDSIKKNIEILDMDYIR